MDDAGVMMAYEPMEQDKCGTFAPGWMPEDKHPEKFLEQKYAPVYFSYGGNNMAHRQRYHQYKVEHRCIYFLDDAACNEPLI